MRKGLKLNEEQVAEIKKALEKPFWGQQQKLAAKYGVSRTIIAQIAKGNIYKDD